MATLPCSKCGGEGRIFKSKYGGNDPDVWDAGKCEACEGSGNYRCGARGCNENAIAFNDDGEALCEDCMAEWVTEENDGLEECGNFSASDTGSRQGDA